MLPGTDCVSRDGTTTYSEGATSCDITVTGDGLPSIDAYSTAEYAMLLSFGLVLDGTSLEAVTRSTTGQCRAGTNGTHCDATSAKLAVGPQSGCMFTKIAG